MAGSNITGERIEGIVAVVGVEYVGAAFPSLDFPKLHPISREVLDAAGVEIVNGGLFSAIVSATDDPELPSFSEFMAKAVLPTLEEAPYWTKET